MTDQTVTDDTPAYEEGTGGPGEAGTEASEPAAGGRRRRPLKRGTRIRLLVIGGIALVVALVSVGLYVVNARNYVTTDNAQIDGNQIVIVAPATGTLTDWTAQQGVQVRSYESVGRIAIQTGFGEPQLVVRAPADGTIAENNEVEGAYVTAGTQLAIAYDKEGVFVTARVDETDIDAVQPGQAVKISVDAFPDAHLTGHVSKVNPGAAGVFSLFPQSNTSGNFQKVTQVIPVKITIDNAQGLALAPGMNVTVKIRRS